MQFLFLSILKFGRAAWTVFHPRAVISTPWNSLTSPLNLYIHARHDADINLSSLMKYFILYRSSQSSRGTAQLKFRVFKPVEPSFVLDHFLQFTLQSGTFVRYSMRTYSKCVDIFIRLADLQVFPFPYAKLKTPIAVFKINKSKLKIIVNSLIKKNWHGRTVYRRGAICSATHKSVDRLQI